VFEFVQDLDVLFSLYDTDKTGSIDYKEFAAVLMNKDFSGPTAKKG
jgi:Ca2+-binding EF-hand superfamily protein